MTTKAVSSVSPSEIISEFADRLHPAPSGRSIGAPTLKFGAALSHVPAPIWTSHKPLMSDQLSKESEMGDPMLPLINEHLARLSAPLVPRAGIGFG